MDSLWTGIGKDQRDKIKRLAREHVSIEEGGTRDDLQGLGMARAATQAKRAARGQGYESNAGAGYYADIFDYLMARDAGRLFVAREGGEVVAGLFFSTFNSRAYSVLSSATENAATASARSPESTGQRSRRCAPRATSCSTAAAFRPTPPKKGIRNTASTPSKKRLGASRTSAVRARSS